MVKLLKAINSGVHNLVLIFFFVGSALFHVYCICSKHSL